MQLIDISFINKCEHYAYYDVPMMNNQTPEMETDLFILKVGIVSRFSKNPDNSKIKVLLNAM